MQNDGRDNDLLQKNLLIVPICSQDVRRQRLIGITSELDMPSYLDKPYFYLNLELVFRNLKLKKSLQLKQLEVTD